MVVLPTVMEAAGPGVPSSMDRTAGAVESTATESVPVVSAIVTESVPRTCDEMAILTAYSVTWSMMFRRIVSE